MWCIWVRNTLVLLKIEKNKGCLDCADQKHVINLTFGTIVCFNGYQLQMFGNKTSHVCHPILEHVFCLLSMLWCNMSGILNSYTYYMTFSKLKHCFTYMLHKFKVGFWLPFPFCETSTWHLFICSFLVHVM